MMYTPQHLLVEGQPCSHVAHLTLCFVQHCIQFPALRAETTQRVAKEGASWISWLSTRTMKAVDGWHEDRNVSIQHQPYSAPPHCPRTTRSRIFATTTLHAASPSPPPKLCAQAGGGVGGDCKTIPVIEPSRPTVLDGGAGRQPHVNDDDDYTFHVSGSQSALRPHGMSHNLRCSCRIHRCPVQIRAATPPTGSTCTDRRSGARVSNIFPPRGAAADDFATPEPP